MTKDGRFFVFLRKQPFTEFVTCVMTLEYSLFVLTNITEAIFVDFVFANAFYANFMYDT